MKRLINLSSFILIIIIFFIPLRVQNAAALELQQAGTTYNQAQVLRWLDENSFIVGRWDGSLSIFRKPVSNMEYGPVMQQSLLTPTKQGIEMITVIDRTLFVTSNGSQSLSMWKKIKKGCFIKKRDINYTQPVGTANSGVFIPNEELLITGHTEGFIMIWKQNNNHLSLVKIVDIRSPDPIPSPYPLKNIRAIVFWKNNTIITGSEDGSICMIKVPSGEIIFRMRYNPDAQRGINDLSLYEDYLLLVNCSVGPADKNLWFYQVTQSQILPIDSYNLIEDTSQAQVFAFCVGLAPNNADLFFVASTEEGLLWLGQVVNNKLNVLSKIRIDGLNVGGAALDIEINPWCLAATSFAIRLFTLPTNN